MTHMDLIAQYLRDMPPGRYHCRDDDRYSLYRDGSAVYSLVPHDKQAEMIVAALVLLLNQRKDTP